MENRSRMRKSQRPVTIAIILCFAFSLLSFNFKVSSERKTAGQHTPAQNNDQSSAKIAAGRRLFAGSCSNNYCHGSDGKSGGGPKLVNRDFTPEYLTQVISNGIPGTSMQAFKNTYNDEQILQLVAYVLSLSPENPYSKQPLSQRSETRNAPATAVSKDETTINDPSVLRGNAAAGEELFFDSAVVENCRVCHTVRGKGGKVGPDLTAIADRPASEILQSIVSPDSTISEKYPSIELMTGDGRRVTGVRRDEDGNMIRIYDTSTLPPVSRAFLKSEVAKIDKLNKSAMPGNYGEKYSMKQLLDLVSFLKTSDPARPVSVSEKDIK